MTYAELVEFAEWMEKHATHRPYVWVRQERAEEGEDACVEFDGVIYPDDVERFNQREKGS